VGILCNRETKGAGWSPWPPWASILGLHDVLHEVLERQDEQLQLELGHAVVVLARRLLPEDVAVLEERNEEDDEVVILRWLAAAGELP
jgi:hypothetical protein